MDLFRHLLIDPNDAGYSTAAKLLQTGQLVAFPTETVYGLGANALDADAVRSIFTAKGRPLTDPVIIHIASTEQSFELIDLQFNEVPIYHSLTKLFWPGPLTIIAKASSIIPSIVTAETGFVSVRYPNHSIACRLISASGIPIAAPSANRFGHVSPTRADHVLVDLGEKGVHVLNGDSESNSVPCQFGIESTVAKIDGTKKQITIFRQGAITQQQLENVLNTHHPDWSVVAVTRTVSMHAAPTTPSIDTDTVSSPNGNQKSEVCVGQEAPGQAVTHYAPDVPCFIVQSLNSSDNDTHTATLNVSRSELLSDCVVIDYHGALHSLSGGSLAYRDLSSSGHASEAAHQLFDTLRWAETVSGAKKVLVASIISTSSEALTGLKGDDCDLTLGVADRVFRAASGQFVRLRIVQ